MHCKNGACKITSDCRRWNYLWMRALGTSHFIQWQTTWPKLPLDTFEVKRKHFEFDFVPKKSTAHCWLLNLLSKKTLARWQILQSGKLNQELTVVFFLPHLMSEGSSICESRSAGGGGGGWRPYVLRWAIASREPRRVFNPSRELSGDVTLDSDWLTTWVK